MSRHLSTLMACAVLSTAAASLAVSPQHVRTPARVRISPEGTVVDQIRFPMPKDYDRLVQALEPAQTLEETEEVLRSQGVPYSRSVVSIVGIQHASLQRLRHAPLKDGFMFEDGGFGYCNILTSADRAVERIERFLYVEGLDPVPMSTPFGLDVKKSGRSVVLLDQIRFVGAKAPSSVRKILTKVTKLDEVANALTAAGISFSRGYTKVSMDNASLRKVQTTSFGGMFAINMQRLLVISKVTNP